MYRVECIGRELRWEWEREIKGEGGWKRKVGKSIVREKSEKRGKGEV